MNQCAMSVDPLWRAKPRVCPHSEVLANGGTCASNTLETREEDPDGVHH